MASCESQQSDAEGRKGDPSHFPHLLHHPHVHHEHEGEHRINQVILRSMNEMRAEFSVQFNELKNLIEDSRCRCSVNNHNHLLPTDQVNELKQLIRSGSCHCAQNET
jgi:D-ribose pyranose/furanose isomerase RbsD